MIEAVFENLLESLDLQGQEQAGDSWENDVTTNMGSLRLAYANLREAGREPINYGGLAVQAAYIFVYAIGRAEFTYELLKRHRAAYGKPIFNNSVAKITSLGGGLGSEVAGIVKYILESGERVDSIEYYVFDKNNEWESLCVSIVNGVSELLPVNIQYQSLNLCDRAACNRLSMKGHDMLVLSFVISELCALDNSDDVIESLRSIYKTLDNQARIFYNDSNAASFYYFFNETKKYVKGLGMVSQVSEIVDNISINLNAGVTYSRFEEFSGISPQVNSDALSKLLVRTIE